MKFSLPRQILDKKIFALVSKEVEKQNEMVISASKKNLKGLAAALSEITDHTLPKHLQLEKLGNNLGMGVFLRSDSCPILKGEVIAPYSGIITIVPSNDPNETGYMFELLSNIHLNREEQLLLHPNRPFHPGRLYSIQLDALKKGNFTRFINHSSHPNLIAHLISTPSKNPYNLEPMPIEVIYIAKKTIHPGEQLLISYENDGENNYWGPAKIKPFPMTPKTFTLSPDFIVVKGSSVS